MKLLGNIIWLVFGGIFIAAEYVVSSLALMVTIVGSKPLSKNSDSYSKTATSDFLSHERYPTDIPQSFTITTFVSIITFLSVVS